MGSVIGKASQGVLTWQGKVVGFDDGKAKTFNTVRAN